MAKSQYRKRSDRQKDYRGPLPRTRLPEPILDECPRWVELYWQALEIGRRKMNDPLRLEVRATHPFTLRVECCLQGETLLPVKPGRNRFEIQARG